MNELQHTGVKGMRWGHRKAKSTSNKKAQTVSNEVKKGSSLLKDDTRGTKIANRLSSTARIINTWRTPLSKDNTKKDVAQRALYTLANAGILAFNIQTLREMAYGAPWQTKRMTKRYINNKKNKIKYTYKKKPWADSLEPNVINMPKGSVRDVQEKIPKKYRISSSLSHTGVKGMRWGHRKAKSTSNKKDLSRLSNDDLRKAINRKRLEQEYNSIGKPNKQRLSVTDTIQIATKFITSISALTVAGLKVYQISSSVNKNQKTLKNRSG